MGSACTTQTHRTDLAIQNDINDAKKAESSVIQLLILGPEGVGKRTIFRQLSTIYGANRYTEDRRTDIQTIRHHSITVIKSLLDELDHQELPSDIQAAKDKK